LERQLQNDTQISGSSPSIYSYEGATNGTAITQEICEKSPQIAITLPTIKVTNPPSTVQFTNSDSEPFSSSASGGSFSGSDDCEEDIKKQTQLVADSSPKASSMIKSSVENRRKVSLNNFRAKNSVDSLSEDSGYCDRESRSVPSGALSLDSSLPTGNDLEDEDGSVIEEKSIIKEVSQMRNLRIRSHTDDDDICYHSMESLNRKFKTRKIDLLSEVNVEASPMIKIDAPSRVVESRAEHATTTTTVKNKQSEKLKIQHEKFISISSPELCASSDNSRTSILFVNTNKRASVKFRDHFSVSSVPDNLNCLQDSASECPAYDSVASKNFNLFDLNYSAKTATASRQKSVDISASCANLTLLNYSDDPAVDFCYDTNKLLPKSRTKVQTMSGKMYSSDDDDDDNDDDDYIASYRSKELSTLLEEISAHFNKNLSILNDREASYEPMTDVRDSDVLVKREEVKSVCSVPPKPPPRTRTQIKTSPNHSVSRIFS
jgi:hypothetical protein